jgi:hypothetical protein
MRAAANRNKYIDGLKARTARACFPLKTGDMDESLEGPSLGMQMFLNKRDRKGDRPCFIQLDQETVLDAPARQQRTLDTPQE